MADKAKEVPPYVARQLAVIDQVHEQVKAANIELKEMAKTDPVCQRLMSVPGVGPVTAVRFVAAVDEISRFGDAHALASYLGLVPGERSSSETVRRLGITKAGSTALRAALVQAAWAARRCAAAHPMGQWCLDIERRNGKFVAVVALARKIAGILYALWKHHRPYDAKRGAAPKAVQESYQVQPITIGKSTIDDDATGVISSISIAGV